MSRDIPPFERLPRDFDGNGSGRRGASPFIIFGIALFGMLSFYAALVVVSQVDSHFLPGNELRIPVLKNLPGVDSGKPPETVEIEDRINIALLGLDIRTDEPDDTPARTDSVVVLTIDPHNKTGGAFSIPRDTLVHIPDGFGGFREDRINVALQLGDYIYRDYPGGGPQLVKDTIEHNFGIPINYYVALNFNNFVQLVDDLGGIEVEIEEYAYDWAYSECDTCPLYSVEFYPGTEHMDGLRALAYVRIRKSDNDFKRIERQQAVMIATARKALRLGTIFDNPVGLYKSYKNTIRTDIPEYRVPGLALLARQIGDNIRTVSMADATYDCPECPGDVLKWDRARAEELMALVFSDGRLQQEHASVQVLNGTDTPDLATQFASFLRAQGLGPEQIAVDEYADGQYFSTTMIVDVSGKAYTAGRLANWLSLPDYRVITSDDPSAPDLNGVYADVVVVLGADAAVPLTGTTTQTGPDESGPVDVIVTTY